VAVKLQRPDVSARVSLDCLLLRQAARVLRRLGRLNTDLPSLVDAWSRSLARELDYGLEAASAWRLGSGLRGAMGASVRVPRAFGAGLTTRKVLTMEWLEGGRLRSAGGAREAGAVAAGATTTTGTAAGRGGQGGGGGRQQQGEEDEAERRRRAEDLRLVEIGVRCFLEQILGDCGYYHADPHAGNLLVLRAGGAAATSSGGGSGYGGNGGGGNGGGVVNVGGGRLGLLDAGMCAEVSRAQRVALLRAALHLAAGEYGALAGDLVALDMLPDAASLAADEGDEAGRGGGGDGPPAMGAAAAQMRQRRQVVAALEDVFRRQLRQPTPFASLSFASPSPPSPSRSSSAAPPPLRSSDDDEGDEGDGAGRGETFGGLGAKLGRSMYRFKFRLPETFTLLVRALSVLEGLALSADPSYRVVAAAFPWVARRVLLEKDPEVRAALRALLYPSSRQGGGEGRAGTGPNGVAAEEDEAGDGAGGGGGGGAMFDFGRLEALLRQAAAVPGGADPGGRKEGGGGGGRDESALALLLSPDAAFVRGLLEDELAKGLDAAWRLAADRAVAAPLMRWLPPALLPLLPPLPLPLPTLPLAPSALAGGPRTASGGGGRGRPTQRQQPSQQRQRSPGRYLATARDEAQIEGLSRLAAAVGALAAAKQQQQQQQDSSGGRPGPAADAAAAAAGPCPLAGRAEQAAAALTWLAREARDLPADARDEALRLPLRVAEKLSSRVAARAIRAALL